MDRTGPHTAWQCLQAENARLREENERLHSDLTAMTRRYAEAAANTLPYAIRLLHATDRLRRQERRR